MKSKPFPLFIDIATKEILIIGAGTIALRRVKTLLSFVTGQHITVISPHFKEDFLTLKEQFGIHFINRKAKDSDLKGKDFVVIATNDLQTNDYLGYVCRQLHILVNVASNPKLCDFYFPAVVEQEGIVIGITGDGTNHKKVKKVREQLQSYCRELRDEVVHE